MNSNSSVAIRQFKEGVIVSLKITLIFALLFTLINQNFSFKAIGYTLLISAMYSFGLGFIQGIINDSLSNKWDWIEHTNTRIWAGIVTTVLYTVPVVLLIDYVNFIVISGYNVDRFFSGRYLWQHVFYIILSFGVSAFIHARGFMIQWKNAVKQESTKQEIVAKTETAKFKSLKNQLDPHFLFNTLNGIYGHALTKSDKTAEYILKLSAIMRYTLSETTTEKVALENEINYLKNYIELQKIRLTESTKIDFLVIGEINSQKIPPLLFINFIENAFKYGVSNEVESVIQIHIRVKENTLSLFVKNENMNQNTYSSSYEMGLKNIKRRLDLIFENNYTLEIINNKRTFEVNLMISQK